jgi:hypothetical protein
LVIKYLTYRRSPVNSLSQGQPSAKLSSMGDFSADLDRLQAELRAAQTAFQDEYLSFASSWQLAIGPLRIRRIFHFDLITLTFISFNVACFAGGILIIFLDRNSDSLGVSLFVGALFSFGAFVSQFWAVAVQQERDVYNRVFGQTETAELKHLSKQLAELSKRSQVLTAKARSLGLTARRRRSPARIPGPRRVLCPPAGRS